MKHRHLAGGIMVTASHNPYFYNGVKFKAEYGGPALSEMTSKIESYWKQSLPSTKLSNFTVSQSGRFFSGLFKSPTELCKS